MEVMLALLHMMFVIVSNEFGSELPRYSLV